MEMDVSLNGLEKCLIGDEVLELPQELLEYENVFNTVFSMDTWESLTKDKQDFLKTFLPGFPENNAAEKQETVSRLFKGENFKFGNPLRKYHNKLKSGLLSPDIAQYFALCQEEKMKEYHYQQQKYYTTLLKQLLEARPHVIAAANMAAPSEPIRVQKPAVNTRDNQKTRDVDRKTRRKYRSILREVREECGELDTSSDESNSDGEGRVLYRAIVTGSDPCTVTSTLTPAAYPASSNADGVQPEIYKVTHEDYYSMLMRHKRRKVRYPHAPEFQTKGLTFEAVISHVYPSKDPVKKEPPETIEDTPETKPPPAKKRAKEKKLPGKESKTKKKTKEKLPSFPEYTIMKKEEGDGQSDDEVDVETDDVSYSRTFGRYISFFSLIRDIIRDESDLRIPGSKCLRVLPLLKPAARECYFCFPTKNVKNLEEKVRDWQKSPSSSLNLWFTVREHWSDNVQSALKFLAGDLIGMPEEYIPFVDYKERVQLWQWIGDGRDGDEALRRACDQWLESLNDDSSLLYIDQQMSPPPPRWVTDWKVEPSSDEDKRLFRQQEKSRFENAHKPFTYRLHGYESVVGPVKGIYNKDTNLKVREHSILIKERPAYITILTLVRDSCARLPNGEGTRADICTVLRDSMYLSDGIEDAQLHTVVSGALDRLHYEKDPCIKYDGVRKIWIYLHRGREEADFEKIHLAQEKAAKAKRSLQKPKVKSRESSNRQIERLKMKDAAVHLSRIDVEKVKSLTDTKLAREVLAKPPTVANLTSAGAGKPAPLPAPPGPVHQPCLSKSLTLPPGTLHQQQKPVLSRSTSAPKGPNSVAGLLQKARQMPDQPTTQRLTTPQDKPKTVSQTIKQLTSTQPFPPPQRLIVGQPTTPMAVFLPTTQTGQQGLTLSLIPATKVPDVSSTPSTSTTQSSTGQPIVPINKIMQQLTKVNVSDLIAGHQQKKRKKKTQQTTQPATLGNVLMSSGQTTANAPKLRVSELASIARASPSVSTISQILQSTAAAAAAVPSSSGSTPPVTVTAPGPPSDTITAMVSVANTGSVTMGTLPLATAFVPIAPAEIASNVAVSPAVNKPVAIAPAAIATESAVGASKQTAIATPIATKPVATTAGNLATLRQMTPQNVVPVVVSSMASDSPTSFALSTQATSGASMVPAQIFVQATAPQQSAVAAAGTRMVAPQHLTTVPAGPPGQIQVVKSVISQTAGQAPTPTAFIIAQSPTPPSAVPSKNAPMKPNKGPPVYARIITPPPNIRLSMAPSPATIDSAACTTVSTLVSSVHSAPPSTAVPVMGTRTEVTVPSRAVSTGVMTNMAIVPGSAPLGVLPTVANEDVPTKNDDKD